MIVYDKHECFIGYQKTTSSKVYTGNYPEFLPVANVLEVVLWMPNVLQLSQRRTLLPRNPYLRNLLPRKCDVDAHENTRRTF